MKILIVGAGAVSSVITHHLSTDKRVSEVLCGSNDLKRARSFIKVHNKKIKLISLDAANINDIVRRAVGVDLIINASLPRFNVNIMEAALKVGAHYQDLASELKDLKTVEQFKFNKRFERAGLTGLINTGVAPGVTNLLAREAADMFDVVDSIHIRCVEEQKASEFVFSWSAETTFDDLTAPPLVYKNGKFKTTKPFHDPEDYEFPGQLGTKRAFSIYGDEVATIPYFIKTKNVDFKSAGADIEFSKALSSLGLFSKKPVAIGGVKFAPLELFKKLAPAVPPPDMMRTMIRNGIIENAIFALTVEVVGKKHNKNLRIKMSAIFPDLKAINKIFPGGTYISYPTGTAAYVFSALIPNIKKRGVFPPEALDSHVRKVAMMDLANHGIAIDQRFQKGERVN
ncbi:MAG: saccharopine dehydrogenase NADP-binding domain-containing protein [Patescibacteria group bacterium]